MSDEPEKKEGAGVPAWVMTFADLMTLLMCFFVLLLSFAEMDLIKFKQVAGSMKEAFGVQKIVPSDRSESTMDFLDGQTSDTPLFEKVGDLDSLDPKALAKLLEEMQAEQTEAEALKLAALLSEEIAAGAIELETTADSIIIRISEKASFPSGRAKLRSEFVTVLDKIHSALAEVEGTVTVAGHTDNLPINTRRFRSNWELSAGRAVSVVHALLRLKVLDPGRFLIEGHGDAHPLVPNDSAENRAKNRRVELVIVLKQVLIEQDAEDDGAAESEEPTDTVVDESDGERAEESNEPSVEQASPEDANPDELETLMPEAKTPDVDDKGDASSQTPEPSSTEKDVQLEEGKKPGKQQPPLPSRFESELPGADIPLSGYDGEQYSREELKLLLQALDDAAAAPLVDE